MREIVLDTETTGLSPAEGHRMVEIGAVEIVHQSPTGRVFHALINPERDIPEDAARVHGHNSATLRDQPIFSEVVGDLLAFIGDAPLVIHNAEFDIGFLNAELTRLGCDSFAMDRVVDTLALARRKHPGQPNTLDALCDRYRIDRSRRVRHGALLDAEILVEIYCELTGGRQRSLVFDGGARALASGSGRTWLRSDARRVQIALITGEEARAHAAHVKSLGEAAVWLRYFPLAA